VAPRLPNPRVPKRLIFKIRAFFVDLEKLIGWTGGNITVSGLNRDGSSLST
jgi:carbohydrate-selective porin OprB